MVRNDDLKPFFLSVDPKDGSMEHFDEIKGAVEHATDLIKNQDTERLIFVAVPHARVRMAVRVEPVDPPPLPAPESSVPAPPPTEWEKSQNLDHKANGHDQ